MTYSKAVRYLDSFFNFERVSGFLYGRELNLERMKKLLAWFHHPEKNFKTILVAGTKGKGSTANFLNSLFLSHQIKTGIYTSPHLFDFRERIRTSNQLIAKSEFAKIVSQIARVLCHKKVPFTYFEISTLIALLHFARKKVDWAILEIGLGGRLDATNAVSQELSILTLIGYDHEEHLGNTIRLIAGEKAAILKHKAPFISTRQPKDAQSVIRASARKVGSKGLILGRDFSYSVKESSQNGSRFDYQMKYLKIRDLRISMAGEFQVENASLALSGFLLLAAQYSIPFSEGKVRKALINTFWPGRCEVIKKSGRTIVLDGAHNLESMQSLRKTLKKLFPHKKTIVLFGISREKNLKAILPVLRKISNRLILLKSEHERALIPKKLAEASVPYFDELIAASSAKEALAYLANFLDASTIGVVTGSLFLVGEARKILKP